MWMLEEGVELGQHAFLKRDIISPMKSQVFNILIPNHFWQSDDDEGYNLYKLVSNHIVVEAGNLVGTSGNLATHLVEVVIDILL